MDECPGARKVLAREVRDPREEGHAKADREDVGGVAEPLGRGEQRHLLRAAEVAEQRERHPHHQSQGDPGDRKPDPDAEQPPPASALRGGAPVSQVLPQGHVRHGPRHGLLRAEHCEHRGDPQTRGGDRDRAGDESQRAHRLQDGLEAEAPHAAQQRGGEVEEAVEEHVGGGEQHRDEGGAGPRVHGAEDRECERRQSAAHEHHRQRVVEELAYRLAAGRGVTTRHERHSGVAQDRESGGQHHDVGVARELVDRQQPRRDDQEEDLRELGEAARYQRGRRLLEQLAVGSGRPLEAARRFVLRRAGAFAGCGLTHPARLQRLRVRGRPVAREPAHASGESGRLADMVALRKLVRSAIVLGVALAVMVPAPASAAVLPSGFEDTRPHQLRRRDVACVHT